MNTPHGWTIRRLGDVLTLINGRAYKKTELLDKGTPVLRIQNLNGGDRWYYSDLDLPAAKYCEAGDLLFAWSATFGPYIWQGPKSIYHYHIWKIELGPELDKSFAYHLLQSITDSVKAAGRGISMIHMTKGGMEDWEVALPPLEEQKRIAGILDQAAELCRLRTRALDKLNTLGQAIFHEMFGDLLANDRAFPLTKVGDVISGFETGKNLAEDPDASRTDGYRVLKISAVTSGTFRPEESKPLPENYEPPETHIVRDGDLLFSRANTSQLIGATAFATVRDGTLVLPDKLWRFKWLKDSPVQPVFVKELFSSPAFRYEIGRRSSGTSGSMKNIGKQKVLSIPFGLPDLKKQKEFVNRSYIVRDQIKIAREQLNLANALFASLQLRAFRGELGDV